MSAREYYEVLGIQPFADGATVDQAYWHLAKTYQNQAITDPRARLLLDELNEAYTVLATPRLREDYDAQLAGRRPASAAGGGRSRTRRLSLAALNPLRHIAWPSRVRGSKAAAGPAPIVVTPPRRVAGETVAGEQPAAPRRLDAAPRCPRRGKADVAAADAAATVEPAPRQKADIRDLRASTSAMLERWRTRTAHDTGQAAAPDMTLVDIFKTEQEMESREDPLAAVMEILKAPQDVIASTTDQ